MAVGGGLRRSLHGLMIANLTEMPLRKFIIYIVLTVDLTAVTKVIDNVKLESPNVVTKVDH